MMKQFFLVLFIFSCCHLYAQFPAESDPHRGIYVDKFAKRVQGGTAYDQSFSILAADENRDGIFEKEDALLNYCAENHITDIELYDLEKILGGTITVWNENTKMNEPLELHLCRFMQKARDQYCITEIGAAGSSAHSFDSVAAFNERYPITEPYVLRSSQRNSAKFDTTLNIVERIIPESDPQHIKAEILKYCLRTTDFNECNPCGARFDNMNTEVEFWYNCANDLEDFQDLLFAMDATKEMYNANHPDHPLKIETYLANLTGCSNLIDVVNFLDGCNNCAPCSACTNPHKRMVDRLLYGQLTGNPNFNNYYVQNLFEQSQTGDSTDFHPLQYAEGINTGGGVDYLGPWFELSPYYTIFTAELYFYNGYRHTGADFWSEESNNLQPGGTLWFAATHMVGPRANPLMLQNTGPYCGYGSPVIPGFIYVGPEDPGMDYEFWVTRDSDGVVVYPQAGGMFASTSTEFIPSDSVSPWHPVIDFADTNLFPPVQLTAGHYTSHLNLFYDHHNGCSYSTEYPLIIENKPAIEIIGDSTFCEGGFTFLKSSVGYTYQWYKDGLPIPGEIGQTLRVKKDGNYYCYVYAWTICDGFTDTVHIHVRKIPNFYVNAFCNGNGTATLKANLDPPNSSSTNMYGNGGALYLWNTGAITDQITVPTGVTAASYRLQMTDPYSGCSKIRDVRVPTVPANNTTPSINIATAPSSPCSHDGVLQAIQTPDLGPTSFLWSTGETTKTISNVAPGEYSVVQTVWAGACSYYATINVGTLPVDSPVVNAVITNVSCHNVNDGAIQLTLTGGQAPFTFYWHEIPDDTVHDPYTQNQANLYAGTYHVSIFDSAGCEYKKSFYVSSSNGIITITTGTINPVTQCAGDHSGSATVSATGGNAPYSYQWNDSAMQTTATASNLYAGSYLVTATDANGCTASQYVSIPTTVVELTAALLNSSITQLNCDTSADGILIVDICGGTIPYTFNGSWTYDSLARLENLGPGDYPVVATDANGCVITDTFHVTAPAPVTSASVITHTTCIGCPDGSILITPSGGTPPYLITWIPSNGNLNGTMIENLPAGIYEICIADSFNCTTCRIDTVLDDPLSTVEIETTGFKIYPNPFNQTSTLYMKNVPEDCVFRIYDYPGRKVAEIYPDKAETLIERKNLESGVYYFELTGKNFGVQKGKIIIY